jgi:predicted nicotinamide N-methyase
VTPEERRAFIAAHAIPTAPPVVPEITLLEGGDSMTLWEAAALTDMRPAVPPPYWAWPWAGGQALARYVLDHPELVRGRVAADIGTGGGVVAIAAALAGATRVDAIDIEPFAVEACRLNAAANGVAAIVDPIEADPTGTDDGWDVVLVGDLWYESEVSRRIEPWLRVLARRGATVLTGDLGRAYLPTNGLETLATDVVPTTVDLEDTTSKQVRVLRILPG